MPTPDDLATWIEGASGPDRELDAAIAAAFGKEHGCKSGFSNSHNGDYFVIEECAAPYTGSIDAALTLLPEGWEFCLTSANGAWVRQDSHFPTTHGNAATPALALAAAAVKAIRAHDGREK